MDQSEERNTSRVNRSERQVIAGAALTGFSLAFFTQVDGTEFRLGSTVQLFLCGVGLFVLWRGWAETRALHNDQSETEGSPSPNPITRALLALFVTGLVGRIAHTQLYPSFLKTGDWIVAQSEETARRRVRESRAERGETRPSPHQQLGWTDEERETVARMFRAALTAQVEAEAHRLGTELAPSEALETARLLADCMVARQEARFPTFQSYTERRRGSLAEAERIAADSARDMAACQTAYQANLDAQRRTRLASAGRDPAHALTSDDLVALGISEGEDPVAYAVHAGTITATGQATRSAWLRMGHSQDKSVSFNDALALWEFQCQGQLRYRIAKMWTYDADGDPIDSLPASHWQNTEVDSIGESLALMVCGIDLARER